MAVLKKVKSATLVEALVATVLIVIIFVIASLVLNNLVLNTFSKKTHQIEYRLNELEYDIQNNVIQFPYTENFEDWTVTIQKERSKSEELISIVATHQKTNKEVIRKRSHE